MGKEIICDINLFTLNQSVTLPDGTLKRIPGGEALVSYLLGACYDNSINTIHFFGNEEYISGIIEEIKTNEMFCYGINNIKCEVN